MLNLSKLPKVGMRTVKTAIAVILCIILLSFISTNSPFYACVAAVVSLQNTVPGSWKAGITRIKGTLIGASIGIILSLVGINNALIIGFGIIIVIYITNLLNEKDSIGIGCIVYLAIMVNGQGENPLSYSLMRVFETFFGIIIAMIVNRILLPPISKNNKIEGGSKVEDSRKE